MSSLSNKRILENEAVFRKFNEEITSSLKDLKNLAKHEKDQKLAPSEDVVLDFFCECADEQCRQRISLKPKVYESYHKDRKDFIVLPGHQVAEVENVIKTAKKYVVVKKHKNPPESPRGLQPTSIANA